MDRIHKVKVNSVMVKAGTVLSSCTGSQEPREKTKQYTTANQ